SRRHYTMLNDSSCAQHTDANGVRAARAETSHADPAAAEDEVALGADNLSGEHRSHAFAQLHHLTHELVADHQRRLDCVLRPLVPALDVEVRAADPGAENAKQHLARPGLRLGDVLQPQAWFPL